MANENYPFNIVYKANEYIRKFGYKIRILLEEDGYFYSVEIVKIDENDNIIDIDVFAENMFENELEDCVNYAYANTKVRIKRAKEEKKKQEREKWLQETIALLSADLFTDIYSPDNGMGYSETVAEVISLAQRFDKELDWQGSDVEKRDYIIELEKFENKVRTERGLIKKTLEEMVSESCRKEIMEKTENNVGKEAFEYIFPAVKKALEEGSGEVREEILSNWLDVDSCRVCSHCGAIMQEGWYLDCQGYACSDECAMEIMNVPDMEHFQRYRIYKEDIDAFLEEEGEGRKEEDLTQEEIEEIIDIVSDDMQACYTEWY